MKNNKPYHLQEKGHCFGGGWETIKKYSKDDFKLAKKHCLNRGMQRKKTEPSYRTRIAVLHDGDFVRIFPDNPKVTIDMLP
jgi:hypothetical protein